MANFEEMLEEVSTIYAEDIKELRGSVAPWDKSDAEEAFKAGAEFGKREMEKLFLCQDEGCDHSGTPHVCNPSPSTQMTREQQIVAMSKVLNECRWFKAPDTGMEVKSLVWATRLWDAANPAPQTRAMGKNNPYHDLYKTGDHDAPYTIKDRNGEVVLGLCRNCEKAEIELSEPCGPIAAMTRDYTGCEYIGMDISRIEKIAKEGSLGATEVFYLYVGPKLEQK